MAILQILLKYYKRFSLMDSHYVFDDAGKLCSLMFFFEDPEVCLLTFIKLLNALLEKRPAAREQITPEQMKYLKMLIEKNIHSKSRELKKNLYDLAQRLKIKAEYLSESEVRKLELILDMDQKKFMQMGVSVLLIWRGEVFRNVMVSFDFINQQLKFDNFLLENARPQAKSHVVAENIITIDEMSAEDNRHVQGTLQTFFNKVFSKQTYTSIAFRNSRVNSQSPDVVFLVFENEFKSKKFVECMKIIINNINT